MAQRIQKGDIVKLISGANKGTTGKVLAVDTKKQTVLIEGIGVGHRKVKPSQLNPRGYKEFLWHRCCRSLSIETLAESCARLLDIFFEFNTAA